LDKVYIIGSGPSGVSCAEALLKKGLEVTMLDAGIELDLKRKNTLLALRQNKPEHWDESNLNVIKGNTTSNTEGIPLKYAYGSDFPYRDVEKYFPQIVKNVSSFSSLAKGGLSNVWEATILPYLKSDILDWPISLSDLAPHYESVCSLMDITAKKDDLEHLFPLYSKNCMPVLPSRQTLAFVKDLHKNKDSLRKTGFVYGYSRIALRSISTQNHQGCISCGLCLYGCPYGAIYNSAFTLESLNRDNNFHYVKDIIVQKLSESKDKVKIIAQSRITGENISFEAARVYLACGVFTTTRILLESLEAYEKPLTMQQSQYFLLPFLRYKGIPNVVEENLHSLSQIFIEVFDSVFGRYPVHLQFYTYNDHYYNAIKNLMGSAFFLKGPVNALLSRLLVIQGYLHSNISPTISVTLQQPEKRIPNKLILEGIPNILYKVLINNIAKKLLINRDLFKGIPLTPLLKTGKPGMGNHNGGTFPMRKIPKEFESDVLGRPYGFKKVHVCDSTVFPSIPATTITLSVMANAHRIGSAYHET